MDQGDKSVDEGWRQILAGASLVAWSGLAHWDTAKLRFSHAEQEEFESGCRRLHPSYGRLIRWLTFSAGAEYLSKGVCLLSGVEVSGGPTTTIRHPQSGEDLGEWSRLVNLDDKGAPEVKESQTRSMALWNIADQVKKLTGLSAESQERVRASLRYLAATIRNRDAHRYAENVRTFHFASVESVFVPSLNALLGTLDQEDLQMHAEKGKLKRRASRR